jgi:hypothetical protein
MMLDDGLLIFGALSINHLILSSFWFLLCRKCFCLVVSPLKERTIELSFGPNLKHDKLSNLCRLSSIFFFFLICNIYICFIVMWDLWIEYTAYPTFVWTCKISHYVSAWIFLLLIWLWFYLISHLLLTSTRGGPPHIFKWKKLVLEPVHIQSLHVALLDATKPEPYACETRLASCSLINCALWEKNIRNRKVIMQTKVEDLLVMVRVDLLVQVFSISKLYFSSQLQTDSKLLRYQFVFVFLI